MNDKQIKTQIATINDIDSFLELQAKYLVTNLTQEQKKDGFVTTPFIIEQLYEIIKNDGLFLAKIEEKVIGYAFAGSWGYFSQWKIIEYMSGMLPISYENQIITQENSFQYGPICIDIEFRGSGLINLLFDFMSINMVKKYPISVTFINKINERSRKAHVEKLGWKIIREFQFNGNEYYFLMLKM